MNYQLHYDRLMQRAFPIRPKDIEVDMHHVIPLCLGGSDTEDNLVALTKSEHFIAHRLLTKIHPNHPGILAAYFNMSYAKYLPNGVTNKIYAHMYSLIFNHILRTNPNIVKLHRIEKFKIESKYKTEQERRKHSTSLESFANLSPDNVRFIYDIIKEELKKKDKRKKPIAERIAKQRIVHKIEYEARVEKTKKQQKIFGEIMNCLMQSEYKDIFIDTPWMKRINIPKYKFKDMLNQYLDTPISFIELESTIGSLKTATFFAWEENNYTLIIEGTI